MNQDKMKYLLIGFAVVICGIFWIFVEKKETISPKEQMESSEGKETAKGETEDSGKIYIHIVGEVKTPGVYVFEQKPRVVEVVEKAGGFTKNAVKSGINQAELVEDGTQIIIASKKKKQSSGGEESQQSREQETSGRLDINAAGREELMTLAGVGESRAKDIISYREKNGRFHKIEDIMNVPGIKSGIFERIRDQIRV